MNNKTKILCIIVSVLLSTTSTRHYSSPKHLSLLLFLHVERVCKSLQVAHLYNTVRVGVFNCEQILTKTYFAIFLILW